MSLIVFRRSQSVHMVFSLFPAAPFVCLRETSFLHCDSCCLQMFVTTCRADRPRLICFPPITHTSKACETSDLIQSGIGFTVISHWSWRDLAQTDLELRAELWCNYSWHMFLFGGKNRIDLCGFFWAVFWEWCSISNYLILSSPYSLINKRLWLYNI